METIAKHLCHGGEQIIAKHASTTCQCDMTFAVYLPPQAQSEAVPALWFLSGLTCTHENVMVKSGFQAYAAKYGIALIMPDTSPRGADVADDEAYDMGQGAGFYVNATEAPWAPHFQMYSYLTEELPALIAANFPQIDMSRQAISGHSMGGHGALTIGLKNPDRFRSITAFAPMTNPMTQAEWGRKQFTAYLGADEANWAQYDACALLASHGWKGDILVDQGTGDNFYDLLQPDHLAKAADAAGVSLTLRKQDGYDHSYFFVTTFADDHFAWAKARLG